MNVIYVVLYVQSILELEHAIDFLNFFKQRQQITDW